MSTELIFTLDGDQGQIAASFGAFLPIAMSGTLQDTLNTIAAAETSVANAVQASQNAIQASAAATQSASDAAGSATLATTQASNSSASASAASDSAIQAATSAGTANTAASQASASATAAANSAASITLPLPVTSGGTGTTTVSGARSALGLGTAATQNTGTSGANVPLLNAANTWASQQTFSVRPTFNAQTPWDSGNLANPMTLDTTQTVSGAKTFSQGIVSNGASNTLGGTASTAGLELGGTTTTTSFIDFHSVGGSGNDYDCRIIASGGTAGTLGKGTLNYTANTHQFNGAALFGTNLTIQNYSNLALSGPAYTAYLRADSTGLVGFINNAGNAWNLQITDAGAVIARANITGYSDERLKYNWEPLPSDTISKVAALEKSGTFDRTDIEGRFVGVGAQSFQAIIPEAVKDVNGTLTVDYGGAALALCVELCREIEHLRERIAQLGGAQ
ncbi:hypothetical protein AWB76_00906 [Caballeronia temeraria]|uniref:Peptidase S74 domain-containing protein n=1 Tax=Caballeronia temeraria TaxID=1777137 RepID=A0A157ZN66_9BURK|nr:tail fiber domain-containing protein [Caballeronia temeraria]SAK46407.1 hypothetical protein AWB76_00906 [Caballeronia temeraria]